MSVCVHASTLLVTQLTHASDVHLCVAATHVFDCVSACACQRERGPC